MNSVILFALIAYWVVGLFTAVGLCITTFATLFSIYKDEATERVGRAASIAIAAEVATVECMRKAPIFFLLWPYFLITLLVIYKPVSRDEQR